MSETISKRVLARYEHVVTGAETAAKANRDVGASLSGIQNFAKKGAPHLNNWGKSLVKAGTSAEQYNRTMHRGSLFMLNFSRGVEDLKFGLPAVINNLDAIAFSYQLMAKEAKESGVKLKDAFWQSIKSPAGVLAIMNLAITGFFLFGDKIKEAMGVAADSMKDFRKAAQSALNFDFSLPQFTVRSKAQLDALIEQLEADTAIPEEKQFAPAAFITQFFEPKDLKEGKELLQILKDQRASLELTERVNARLRASGLAADPSESRKKMLEAGDKLIESLEKENVLLAEQEALSHKIANYRLLQNNTAQFEGTPMEDFLGTEGEIDVEVEASARRLKTLETSADRIAKAFRDGLNQEIEGTAIALEQWPLDVVDGLSATISESAYDLLTLQGGFKDFGNDVLNIMKRQVAEMAAMIVKQKLLNALKKREGAMSGLSNIGGIFGGLAGLGGGTLLPLAGIAAAMYGVASIGRSSHKGSQVGSFRDRPQNRIQLQAATLPSGDVRFAANESNMRISRLGA